MRFSPPIVVIDFETTGLSTEGGDRVVEIGMVRLDPDLNFEREYTTLVNPQCDMGATRIHGIRRVDVLDAPTFADIAGDVGEFLEGAALAAHNAPFDIRFLRSEYEHIGLPERLPPDVPLTVIDTLNLVSYLGLEVPDCKLPTLCAACGIPEWSHHGALGDARATALLLKNILERGGGAVRSEIFRSLELLPRGWTGRKPSGRLRPRTTLSSLARTTGVIPEPTCRPPPLDGEVAVFTGSIGLSRDEAIKAAEILGCRVAGSVSGKTSIVVVGDPDAGRWSGVGTGKSQKHVAAEERAARGQRIRILTEADFLRLGAIASDGVITDGEWMAVRDLVYGPGHAAAPPNRVKPSKPRRRPGAACASKLSPATTHTPVPLRLVPPIAEPAPLAEEVVAPLENREWPSVRFLREHSTATRQDLARLLPAFAALLEMDADDATRRIASLGDTAGPSQVLDAMEELIVGYAELTKSARDFISQAILSEEERVKFATQIGGAIAAQLGPSKRYLPTFAQEMSGSHRERAISLLGLVEAVLAAL
jgi:DNA polymerase III epsilon subunit-like protein